MNKELAKVISKFSIFSPKQINYCLNKFHSVDLVLNASQLAPALNMELEEVCYKLWRN